MGLSAESSSWEPSLVAVSKSSIAVVNTPPLFDVPAELAVEFDPGMPRLSSGTSAVAVTTLLADSGAAMPSGDPFPNSSGCLDIRFSHM